MKKVFVALFLTLVGILVLTSESGEGFSCDDVKEELFPCLDYITGEDGDTPSSECCEGIIDLKSSTRTKKDRRIACECLKAAAIGFSGLRDDLAASLPKQCGVNVGFTISSHVNCNSIP
ncbi:putative plant lipid transfer protein/Par allergen [Lupinus albus]|uniref:Non-specific lipid-transfer protein n=1 Tax=Lupinus albus TaxID=3870 RepID=A0A6A4PXN4_LUPAL|nr:putative plant lipid transfer protein/Par allergen [Lupinus albus]